MIEIKRSGNILDIYGNIKSIQDYEAIRSEVNSVVSSYDSVVLNLHDSISITSSVIGYLNKLVDEGKRVVINVKDDMLYNLFNELNLLSTFNVQRLWLIW